MPGTLGTTHTAAIGFVLSGNDTKETVEPGEEFVLASEENRFGAGRRMVSIMDTNNNLLGYVTTGQAELIRRGDC